MSQKLHTGTRLEHGTQSLCIQLPAAHLPPLSLFSTMQHQNELVYRVFARYYRAFFQKRKHFKNQSLALKELLEVTRMPQNARILDAACGTADVLDHLYGHGYRNLFGIDGCHEMLAEAASLQAFGSLSLVRCRWQDVDTYFSSHGQFDLIFMLGLSLSHVKREEIPGFVKKMKSGLRQDGVFAFDMRKWIYDQNGVLVEPNRPIGVWRQLGTILIEGQKHRAEDHCVYDSEGYQKVTYRFKTGITKNADFVENVVSFCIFDTQDVRRWLEDAGLAEMTFHRSQHWPQLMVFARSRQ